MKIVREDPHNIHCLLGCTSNPVYVSGSNQIYVFFLLFKKILMFFGLEAIHMCFLWTMMMQATMKAIRLEHLNLGVSLAGPVQVGIWLWCIFNFKFFMRKKK